MSKAKEEYYKFKAECDRYHEGLIPDIDAYVSELEEELSRYKLQAIVDRETINSVNDRNKMLEQQKAELISTLGMALSTPHRKLYLVQMKETLKKYTGE